MYPDRTFPRTFLDFYDPNELLIKVLQASYESIFFSTSFNQNVNLSSLTDLTESGRDESTYRGEEGPLPSDTASPPDTEKDAF